MGQPGGAANPAVLCAEISETVFNKSLYYCLTEEKTRESECDIKMSKIFSWEYFSFLTLDDGVVYKEVLVVPGLILVLAMVWMHLVKGQTQSEAQEQSKKDLNFEQAYQDAVLNEVDSGTEMDSQAEEEVEEIGHLEETAEKAEEEKKDD